MNEFIVWFFGLKMDAIVGPWLKDNIVTITFILGLPYLVYKWWFKNMQQIKALKKEENHE